MYMHVYTPTCMKLLGWWCLGLCVYVTLLWFSICACYGCSIGIIERLDSVGQIPAMI